MAIKTNILELKLISSETFENQMTTVPPNQYEFIWVRPVAGVCYFGTDFQQRVVVGIRSFKTGFYSRSYYFIKFAVVISDDL